MDNESAWVRMKLKLPPNASLQDVQGKMHVWDSRASGYMRYIDAHKCDDKQGEIARLSVANGALLDAVRELCSFVGVMFGRGAEATIPNMVHSPLGIPIKLRDIMLSARAAIAAASPPEGKSE